MSVILDTRQYIKHKDKEEWLCSFCSTMVATHTANIMDTKEFILFPCCKFCVYKVRGKKESLLKILSETDDVIPNFKIREI